MRWIGFIAGSVDLEIYGEYAISNKEIHFKPLHEQLQPYALYGRTNTAMKDSIAFNYIKPTKNWQQLFFCVDKKWVKNPARSHGSDKEVYYKLKKQKIKRLKVNLVFNPEEKDTTTFKTLELFSANIPKGTNDFMLWYNVYYYMRKRFAKTRMRVEDGAIIYAEKTRQKESLGENDKENLIKYLERNSMFPSKTISRENEFTKINLTIEKNKPILRVLENGAIIEE